MLIRADRNVGLHVQVDTATSSFLFFFLFSPFQCYSKVIRKGGHATRLSGKRMVIIRTRKRKGPSMVGIRKKTKERTRPLKEADDHRHIV